MEAPELNIIRSNFIVITAKDIEGKVHRIFGIGFSKDGIFVEPSTCATKGILSSVLLTALSKGQRDIELITLT